MIEQLDMYMCIHMYVGLILIDRLLWSGGGGVYSNQKSISPQTAAGTFNSCELQLRTVFGEIDKRNPFENSDLHGDLNDSQVVKEIHSKL